MYKLVILVSFFSASVRTNAQSSDTCEVLRAVYNDLIAQKYVSVHIVNFTKGIDEMISSEILVSSVDKELENKTLQKVKTLFHGEPEFWQLQCFNNELSIKGDSILSFLNSNRLLPINTDTPFVKFVDNKQKEISLIANDEIRMKLLNELTLTPEFEKYSVLLDYNTPRLIQFSNPIFVDSYCIMTVEVIKNNTDDRIHYICLYKKINSKWRLLKIAYY
jgi:hypothetical protein